MNCLPTPRENQIKHGPRLAGVVTGVAGVVTVGRTYGASLFGRVTSYINGFISTIPHIKSGFCDVKPLDILTKSMNL